MPHINSHTPSLSAAGAHIASAWRGSGGDAARARSKKLWFAPHSRVEIMGEQFRLISSNDHAHEFLPIDDKGVGTGPTEFVDHEELIALGDKVREHVDALRPEVEALKSLLPSVSIRDLPRKKLERVLHRNFFCDGHLRAEAAKTATRSDKSMKVSIALINQAYMADETARQTADGRCGTEVRFRRPPSPTTLRRWLIKYEAFSFEPMALCDSYGRSGNTTPRFEAPERRILREVAGTYASRKKPTKVQVYKDLEIAINTENVLRKAKGLDPLVCPGKKALKNEIDLLDPYHVYAARETEEKARKKFFIVKAGLDVTFPLERIEMDESLLPLQVFLENAELWGTMTDNERAAVKRSRLWVSTAIDARTRCFLAIRLIRRLTGAEAVATLEMAVNDKGDYALAAGCRTPWDMMGRPICVCVDNGKSWISHEFKGAVLDLRSGYMFAPAGLPQMRGRKERAYRTINQQLISCFDGRSFENVVAKGGYDSEALAQINEEELGHLLVRYIVDVYHNQPHSGLGGETPRNCWLRLETQYGKRLPPSRDENRHIFGTTVEVDIGTDGVPVLGNLYQSLELQQYRSRTRDTTVLVRIGTSDLGVVSVRTDEGWITVPCKRAGMEGVSVRHWMLTVQELRRRFASEADMTADVVLEALRDIREVAETTRLRAGISSPIMTIDDYHRFRNAHFRDFRSTEEAVLPLVPITGTADDDVTPEGGDAEVRAGSEGDPESDLLDVSGDTPAALIWKLED